MGSEWREVTLSEVADEITVGFVGTMANEYLESGVPFLRSLNVDPYIINTDDLKYISQKFHTRLSKSKLKPGDVVIVRTGKPGTAAVVPEWLQDANCSDLVVVRPGPGLHARFLAYYVNSAACDHIEAHTVGAVQQHFNIGSAKQLVMTLPPLAEQRAIAGVLGALDDKIAANRRLSGTLEALARRLFRSWFVDFDPVVAKAAGRRPVGVPAAAAKLFPAAFADSPLGPIPQGWQACRWGDIATLEYGKALRTHGDGADTYRVYGTNGPIGWHSESLSDGEGIVIGRKGAYRGVHYSPHPFFVIDTAFYLKPVAPLTIKWAYYEISQNDINSMDSGSAIPSTSRADFYSLDVCLPPEPILAAFESIVLPLFTRQQMAERQSRTLASLRDALLPRLLSGELRVRDAAKLTGEVFA